MSVIAFIASCLAALIVCLVITFVLALLFTLFGATDSAFDAVVTMNEEADKRLNIQLFQLQQSVTAPTDEGFVIHRCHGIDLPVRAKLSTNEDQLANAIPVWSAVIEGDCNPSIAVN